MALDPTNPRVQWGNRITRELNASDPTLLYQLAELKGAIRDGRAYPGTAAFSLDVWRALYYEFVLAIDAALGIPSSPPDADGVWLDRQGNSKVPRPAALKWLRDSVRWFPGYVTGAWGNAGGTPYYWYGVPRERFNELWISLFRQAGYTATRTWIPPMDATQQLIDPGSRIPALYPRRTRPPERPMTLYRGCHRAARFNMSWTPHLWGAHEVASPHGFGDYKTNGPTTYVYRTVVQPEHFLGRITYGYREHDDHPEHWDEFMIDANALSDQTVEELYPITAD